uniref:Uncharacterized protein n=1 Tax=Steinernema glaseri TaxID=37863 RepID=A0A1I8AUN2_9BILA
MGNAAGSQSSGGSGSSSRRQMHVTYGDSTGHHITVTVPSASANSASPTAFMSAISYRSYCSGLHCLHARFTKSPGNTLNMGGHNEMSTSGRASPTGCEMLVNRSRGARRGRRALVRRPACPEVM